VPRGLRRIHGGGNLHFITTSCYQREDGPVAANGAADSIAAHPPKVGEGRAPTLWVRQRKTTWRAGHPAHWRIFAVHIRRLTTREYWKRYLLIQFWFTLAFAPIAMYLDVKSGLNWQSSLTFYLIESFLLALWLAWRNLPILLTHPEGATNTGYK